MRRVVPYVLPLPTPARGGPLAAWVGAWGAGLAAPEAAGFELVVVSPEGTFPADALGPILEGTRAESGATAPPKPERRRKTLAKDARAWARQRAFAALAAREVQKLAKDAEIPFVLTRHVLFAGAGRAAAEAVGVPLATWVHAALIAEAATWGTRRFFGDAAARWFEHRPLSASDAVIAVTDKVLADLGLAPSARVIVNGNGTELGRFHLPDRREDAIVWVGSFRGFHGVEAVVEAFAGTPPGARLILVGDGPRRAAVAEIVERAGLSDRVEMPGFVSPAELPRWLARAKVGVVASGHDLSSFHYSPVKLREYAAAGLVVCTPLVGEMAGLAGERWAVGHDNTGPGLGAAFQRALAVAAEPGVHAAARAFAEANYGWGAWWRRTLDAVRR